MLVAVSPFAALRDSVVLLNVTALHIPDGFLNLPISILAWLATAALLAVAIRRTRGELGERQVPLMGVMAAFLFAAQMINFPVAGERPATFSAAHLPPLPWVPGPRCSLWRASSVSRRSSSRTAAWWSWAPTF